MTTPYWSDFVPNSTFYRILSGFHRTFATGVACRQGTLTPPDTWSRPFGTCICSTCWDQSFSELVVILPDCAIRISLGTLSVLLRTFSFYHNDYLASIVPKSWDVMQVVQNHSNWRAGFSLYWTWFKFGKSTLIEHTLCKQYAKRIIMSLSFIKQ